MTIIMLIIQIYFIGLAILVAALLLNTIAMKLRIVTWYDFVKKPSSARWFDYVWLFILYPALLGSVAILLYSFSYCGVLKSVLTLEL